MNYEIIPSALGRGTYYVEKFANQSFVKLTKSIKSSPISQKVADFMLVSHSSDSFKSFLSLQTLLV